MADYDYNPYADGEGANPFADPSVQQATQSNQRPPGIDDFNPFADANTTTPTSAPATQKATMPPPQPAVMNPTPPQQPPAYTPETQAATDDLKRRQEELEKKAAELARKEQEMQRNMQINARENNFPPLPSKFPVKPCFYQDISVDIPLEFQRVVKMAYYSWIAYVVLLFLNLIGALAYFIAASQSKDIGGNGGLTFGLSILWLVLFTPCSFVCWFRPIYKAFRSDSSLNFFVFFFIYFFQFCFTVLFALGIDSVGSVGFLNGMQVVTHPDGGRIAGAIMLVIGFLFACLATCALILLIRIHRIYRTTGASFEKAQAEFGHGVATNKTVQKTAANVATSAVQSQFQGDNRY